MAKVKIVYGPAGSGKTYRAVDDFYNTAKKCDPLFNEKNCFLVVPEQLAVETEKKFFEKESKGLIGSEVISFARLVHRILSDAGVSNGMPLTNTMRTMLLVKTLSGIEDNLAFFKTVSERPSAVSRLSATLSELEKYGVTPERLDSASNLFAENKPDDRLTAGKLSDLSKILNAYIEVTREYNDSSALALRAIETINSGKSCIEGASVFFDSFSGFTDVELSLVKAMANHASEVTFYVFKDADSPVFSIPNRTFDTLYEMFDIGDVIGEKIKPDIKLSRYKDSEMLYILSRNYATQRPASLPESAYDGTVRIVAAADFYHELEKCARTIAETVSGDSGITYSDIAVALPSVSDNYYIIDAVFKDFGIPCFIDAKAEYSGHRIVRLFDSLFKVLAGENIIDNLLLMLKTGLYKRDIFNADDVDSLENYFLKYACVKKQSFKSLKTLIDSLSKGKDENDGEPGYLILAKDIYGVFAGEQGLCKQASSAQTVNDVLNIAAAFAGICGLREVSQLNDASAAGSRDDRDFIRVRNSFIDLLNECSFAIGNVRKNGCKKLIKFTGDVLMSAAASIKAASIPFSGDYVQVGDLERSGYVDKKIMMVLGANAGSFPGNVPDSSFLGDEERKAIEEAGGRTAYNSYDRALLLQFNVYRVLTCPEKQLYLSYSIADSKGEEQAPASAVLAVKKIFRNIKTEFYIPDYAAGENVKAAAGGEGAFVDADTVRKLLRIEKCFNIKVTALDDILKCPYAYFFKKCLNITERDLGEYQANVSGTYVHALLEGAVKKAIDDGNLENEDPDVWSRYIGSADEDFKNNPDNEAAKRAIENSDKSIFLAYLTRMSVKRELVNLSKLCKEDSKEPLLLEVGFGRHDSLIPPVTVNVDGVDVRIRGIIDRVDAKVDEDGVKLAVTDYKTVSYDIAKVKEGKSIQLPVYSLAILNDKAKALIREKLMKEKGVDAKDITVDTLRYYIYGGELGDNNKLHTYSSIGPDEFAELFGSDNGKSFTENIISDSVRQILGGSFPAEPDSRHTNCSYCSCKNICRIRNGEDETNEN